MKDSEPPTPGTLPTRMERPRRAAAPKESPAADLPEGFVLGRYRIVRLLGSGGMGSVYEAVHMEMGKSVALKVLRQEAASDPQARARFLREAAASSRIQHPHVLNVTDYGAEDALPFIVMQLLRGEDLSDRLDRHPRGLAVAETADILLAVCAGVFAAHAAGIVHRDIKPKNIFLARVSAEEISPKVLDFGISKMDDRTSAVLTNPGDLLGTTHYLSPEQVAGRPVDARTDQHALGVVLYECLTGHRPYEAETPQAVIRAIGSGRFASPAQLRPDLPPALADTVLRAMAHDPAHRFPSAHALGAALLSFASDKKQVAWADYYAGPRERSAPEAPARSSTASLPRPAPARTPSPAPILDTQLLATPQRPPAYLQTRPSELRRRDQSVSAPPAPAARRPAPPAAQRAPAATFVADGTQEQPAGRSGLRGRLLSALVAAVVLATAGRLLVRLTGSLREDARSASTATVTPPAATVTPPTAAVTPPTAAVSGLSDRPAQRMSDPAGRAPGHRGPLLLPESPPQPPEAPAAAHPPAPPPPSGEVTFRIADAPPGLTATIAETAVELPLRLRRGAPAVTVTFRAPGHESRDVTVSADSDPTIELRLRPTAARRADPNPAGNKRRPAVSPRSPLAPNVPIGSPSPAPIIDI